MNGGSGVSIGGVRSLRADCYGLFLTLLLEIL